MVTPMNGDFTTELLRRYAGPMSARRAEKIILSLDRTLIQLFPVSQRASIRQIMPGMAGRRMGALFGITPKALRTERIMTWTKALETIKTDLRITNAMALELIDAYLKAHLTLMPAQSRLSFAEASPDDLVRAYLRALEA